MQYSFIYNCSNKINVVEYLKKTYLLHQWADMGAPYMLLA